MKLGICFAGGGARGAYEVGAAQAMKDLGILQHAQAFSGTSIGSVNAAFIATIGPEKTYEMWKTIHQEDIRITESLFKRVIHEGLQLANNGLYEINKLRTILTTLLDEKAVKSKEIYVTVANSGAEKSGLFGLLKSTYAHYTGHDSKVEYALLANEDDEDVSKLILASCSIPVAFPAVDVMGKQYYDGGVYDNVPVEPLVRAGCDFIIVVHLFRHEFVDRNRYPGVRITEIKHWRNLGGILNFDPQQAQKCYDLGYADAMTKLAGFRIPTDK